MCRGIDEPQSTWPYNNANCCSKLVLSSEIHNGLKVIFLQCLQPAAKTSSGVTRDLNKETGPVRFVVTEHFESSTGELIEHYIRRVLRYENFETSM